MDLSWAKKAWDAAQPVVDPLNTIEGGIDMTRRVLGGDVSQAWKKPMGDIGQSIAGMVKNYIPKNLVPGMGDSPQAPSAPGMDPRVLDAMNKQTEAANKYRAGLPGLQESMYGQAGNETRRSLAQQMSGTNAGYNSRGLLYSGLRQGAIADEKANASAALAGARASINQQTNANADTMDKNAILAGQGFQQQGLVSQDLIYQQALQQAMQRMGVLGALGGAGGGLLGTAMGR